MKICIMSDLHKEMASSDRPPEKLPEHDVVVLAGDISKGVDGIEWSDIFGPNRIYVAGNHEYYKCDYVQTLANMKTYKCFLENRSVDIDGVRFFGCTLWTDYALYGEVENAMQLASMCLNDHRVIMYQDRYWMPEDALEKHNESVKWLEEALDATPDTMPRVVVTHHCPHPNSVHQRWQGDPVTPAFCSDLTRIIEDNRIDLWIHGHTHDAHDYIVHGTRVICNPRGYMWENPEWQPKVVEIPS